MIQRNTQHKIGKKSKGPRSEEKEMAPLYIDTACKRDAGIATWEGMYNLLEEENPRIMEVTATAGSNSSSEASITELACSFLRRIVARPKILPYMNMVKWILDNVDIKNRQFKTQGQRLIGSFTAQDLKLMYHLSEPLATYNKHFTEKFAKENQDLAKTTKYWSRRDESFKKDKHGMYSTGSLTSSYCFGAAMLYRLFGMLDINKFSSEWLPLLDAITNATIVDWAKIFLDNLVTAIVNY